MFYRFRPGETSLKWEFRDPDTKYHYVANSREELAKKIIGYREQNELEPLDSLGIILDTYLCTRPYNLGKCQPVGPLRRGFLGYLKGGIAVIKNFMYSSFVSQEVADKRAEICIKCPHHVDAKKAGMVKWTDDLMVATIGNRKSKYHDQLKSCEVCTCDMRGKIWYGGKIDLTDEQIEKMKKVGCWQPEFSK